MNKNTLKVTTNEVFKAYHEGYYNINSEVKFAVANEGQRFDKYIYARVMVATSNDGDQCPKCVATMQLNLIPDNVDTIVDDDGIGQLPDDVYFGAEYDTVTKLCTHDQVWIEFEIPGNYHDLYTNMIVTPREEDNDEYMIMDESGQADGNLTLLEVDKMIKAAVIKSTGLTKEELGTNPIEEGDKWLNDDGEIHVYNGTKWVLTSNEKGIDISNELDTANLVITNADKKGVDDDDVWISGDANGSIELYGSTNPMLILEPSEETNMVRFFGGVNAEGKSVETLAINCNTGEVTFGEEGTIEEKHREAWISFSRAIQYMSLQSVDFLSVEPPQPHNSSYERAMGILK